MLGDICEEDDDSGEALVFEGIEVEAFTHQPSVRKLRQELLALQACEALVAAYRRGADSGGSVAWEDIDAAHALALQTCDAIDEGSPPAAA
jgi:hypothetical protein